MAKIRPSSTRSTPVQPPRRVLLVVSTTFALAHQIIRGVTAYAHERGPAWELVFRPGQSVRRRIEMFAAHAQAAIIQIQDAETLKAMKLIQGPVVLVDQPPQAGLPLVRVDNRAVGRMAFEHLAGQGFKNFAYWGDPEIEFSQIREKGFAEAVRKAGLPFYPQPGSQIETGPVLTGPDKLTKWMLALPRPVAILASNDWNAAQVVDTCHTLGVYLPDEIAILGVDNDALLCESVTPRLSSIDQGCWQVGYQAARLIDLLLDGKPAPRKPLLVPPARVVGRHSTDTLAIEDRDVVEAIRFIRAHALQDISVEDVLREVVAARRTLEIRFKRYLGRTIHQEILRLRLEHAKYLLSTSSLAMKEICQYCGFSSPSYFTQTFTQTVKQSPSQFRHKHRSLVSAQTK